jgi:hypothetical protein
MKRVTTQRPSSYTLAWHWPTNPRDTLGQSNYSNSAVADVLMHAEALLKDGYGVTITPPATARHTPLTVEVVDLEVIHG